MDNVLKEALRLHKMGFAVHWLRPASKIPVESGWSNAPVQTAEELIASYQRGYNVGFRPGGWSVVKGKEIVVLDVDIRGGQPFADEAHAAARQLLGGLDFHVISGSGVGRHAYLAVPVGTAPAFAATTLRQSDVWVRNTDGSLCKPCSEDAKPAWLIELLSTGKNVVMPPSIHPDTNIAYKFIE